MMSNDSGTGWERRTVRGIVHCHTELSYDSRLRLEDLVAALRAEGFHFVALTEHSRGVDATRYSAYRENCRRVSDEHFVAIPGLEVLCEAGVEIAGLGLPEVVEPGPPDDVTARVRQLGGYAIWVHPLKRGGGVRDHDCDALEVLNGKLDGDVAPDPRLIGRVARLRRQGLQRHAIFGLDLHHLGQARRVWVECQVAALREEDVLTALREGRFVSRVANVTIPSSGRLGLLARLRIGSLRTAAAIWNTGLSSAPEPVRLQLHRWCRPVVEALKRLR